MRSVLWLLLLLGTSGCASQPGRDGPARPTSDTTRYPGEATDPLDPASPTEGSADSTPVWP